ncbi:MAG: tRNA lysidine(34) synthetase TilS [Chloroflexi bacterium]|nr:tRNA lysidine(34) synthetase TilS [Chloroflexota bacterium]
MLEAITTYIEQHKLLPPHSEIIVAFSGGADSLCLLHLLHSLCGPGKRYPTIHIHAAHLNHQLRGEASTHDAVAVAQIAESWGLPVTIGSIDVPALARQEQRSLEDAARTARYRFLREVALGRLIAVAHHMDDQVETLLLHWLRGGGIASMVGLQPRQQDIIRPLLVVAHADTVAYCRQHHLTPLEDESNTDIRFLRNRIRHELLPMLETINPGIRETLVRNAEVMRIDVEWIETQVDSYWQLVVAHEQDSYIQLRLKALTILPLSLQHHLLRRVTAHLSAGQSPLELRHYRLIEQLMQRECSAEELTLHLPKQLHVTRRGEMLAFQRVESSNDQTEQAILPTENEEVMLTIPGRVAVPGTPWIAVAESVSDEIMQAVHEPLLHEDWAEVWRMLPSNRYAVYTDGDIVGDILQVRTRRPGDRIRPLGMAHEKKVQDVLVDGHIARSERAHIPLFFARSHCVWLAGIHLDDRVRLTSRTQRIIRLAIIPNS